MSKVSEIREVCGDYALDVEYSKDFTFTMFFNSRRNAETVKRCIEVDDSVPNVATAVDFVEVVRCKDCMWYMPLGDNYTYNGKPAMHCFNFSRPKYEDGYCDEGVRRKEGRK